MSPPLPQVAAFLEQLNDPSVPAATDLSVEEMRQAFRGMAGLAGRPEPAPAAQDVVVPGPGGPLALRVYRPAGDGRWPLVVYFHGGGWMIGGLDTCDALCQHLAVGIPAVVVSVDYRLAPEHPFPAAVEDAEAATAWAAAHAAQLGAEGGLVLAGDSAGGNLAAVVSRRARDNGGPAVDLQLLLYPATDLTCSQQSYEDNAEGYLLTAKLMERFIRSYLAGADAAQVDVSPLLATDVHGLPPAHVVTAEFDPLRDEGEAYARRLAEAGVPVTVARYDGTIHYFLGMDMLFDDSRRALEETVSAVRVALERPPRGG